MITPVARVRSRLFGAHVGVPLGAALAGGPPRYDVSRTHCSPISMSDHFFWFGEVKQEGENSDCLLGTDIEMQQMAPTNHKVFFMASIIIIIIKK